MDTYLSRRSDEQADSPAASVKQASDHVTVLRTFGPLATKRYTYNKPTGTYNEPAAYGMAATFSISEHGVSNIHEFAALLDQIGQDPQSFVVRGKPAEGVNLRKAKRRLHPRKNLTTGEIEPATLVHADRHWVLLDIDDVPCPENIDRLYEPNEVVEHVVSVLPPEFDGVTCWWCFTSSHGIKDGIRLRLAFWSDRPLSTDFLKAWLGNGRWPVDEAVFSPSQPNYVAKPIFADGAPDPVPYRSGVWIGHSDEFTAPDIDLTKPAIDSGTRTAATKAPGLGYEGYRAEIGDHSPLGFNKFIKAAVGAYLHRHGSKVDTTWLRNDLEAVIRERGHTRSPAYVENRVRDLDGLIESIRRLQSATEERTKRTKFERCGPSFTAPTTTAAEACGELKAAFDPAWNNQVLPAVQARRQWEVEAAAAKDEKVTLPDHPLMPQIGLAPSMGVGKTEIIIQAATSTKDVRTAMFIPTHALAGDVERRINDLEAEGAAVWSGMERPDPEAPGCAMCPRWRAVKVAMACGGDSTDVCGNRNKGWCHHHPKHPQSGEEGFEICGTQRQNMEMAADQNRIVLMPHAMITNPLPKALKRAPIEVPFADRNLKVERSAFDVTAIDEAPWLSMVKIRSARVDLSDLNRSYVDQWRVPPRAEDGDPNYGSRRLREISVRTHDVLMDAYDKTAFVRLDKSMFSDPARTLTSDMCHEANKLTWRLHIDPAQKIKPDMSDDEIARVLRPLIPHNRAVRRMARLWLSLAEFLASDEDQSPYLTLVPRAEKDADGDEQDDADDADALTDEEPENVPTGETVPCIAMSWKMDIHPDWLTGPVVFADGTMNEGLARHWLPSLDVVCRVQASTPRSVYRRQVIDRPVSHHMICPRKTDKIDKNEKTRRNHAADLARLLELRASQHKGKGREIIEADGSRTRIDVGFIGPKALEDYWRDNGMMPPDRAVEVHHSGNVRGMTRLEVIAHQTIASRALTAPVATEELAWVISGHIGQCLPKGEWYPTRDAGVLMRDGTGRKVQQVYHPDPVAEAVRWQICEANVLQDEARGRAVRRSDDTLLTIDILTNVLLPLEVDEVVTYDDIMAEVDQVSMSVARGMIAFDWLGVGLVCRDMFRASNDLASAAKMWGSRNPGRRAVLEQIRGEIKGTPPVTNSLYIYSSYKEFVTPPSHYRVYRYRPIGGEVVREMAINTQLFSDPRAALEEVTGALEIFEHVAPPKTEAAVTAAPEPPLTVAQPATPSNSAALVLKALKLRRLTELSALPQEEPGAMEEDFEDTLALRHASIHQHSVAAWRSENKAEYRQAAESLCQTRYNEGHIKTLGDKT